MDLRSIYITNGVGVFILLVLLYVSRTKTLRRNVEDRIFSFMIAGIMLGCIMEALSYTIDGNVFTGSRVINYIANTYLYCANLLLPFSVLVYVDLGLYGDGRRIWKNYKPQIVIGAIMIAMNIINFFVPVTYYITEQNVYERRPLCYVYYLVIVYYLITAFLLTRSYEKQNGTRTFFSITVFMIPILLGAGLQFAFYGLSLAWLASAVGLVGMFMMQQNELAYIDALVDTYNRQYMNHVLTAWIARGFSFSGAMIDVDDFKSINDTYGHTEGDAALKALADILKQSAKDGEVVFRFAGDEFIVLKMTDLPNALSSYFDVVNRNLEEFNRVAGRPYHLMLSYGISHFSEGDIDVFIGEMDDGMYKMKALHHEMRDARSVQ